MQLDNLTPQECWQLSLSEREEYHRRLLLAQLAWVSREVPFYRRLNLPLADLRRLGLAEILAALPMVTKEMIRGRNPDFLSATPLKGIWTKTGGSTGEPTEIFHDYLKIRQSKASLAFARQWWGLKLGQRCFYVWGHSASLAPGWPGVKDRILRPFKDLLRLRLRVNAYRMDQKSLGEYVRRLIRFQPLMIMGYTSSIYLLAQKFLDDGCDAGTLPRLRGVIVTADPCYPFQAELIRTAFGAPVIVEYGSVEVGVIAYDHPDGTFRVLEDRLVVETVPHGDGLYDLVVTDLGSRSQPLIRFAMDDQCQKPLDMPPHGEGFRTLGAIDGRVLDSVVGAGGRRLHGVALSHIVNASYPGVLRYRFHQQASGRLRVELQLKPRASKDPGAEAHLLAYLQNELGAGTPIELTYLESFPPTPSGKFRWVVSEMRQNQGTPTADRPGT
jgi:phenylacetate-CoA ligase